MQPHLKKVLLLLSTLTTLSACGGGGGSGGSSTSTQPTAYPVQSAISSVYSKGTQSTLPVTGTVSNGTQTLALSGSITFAISAAVPGTFNAAPALQSTVTVVGSLIVNGQTSPLNSISTAYLNAAYAALGSSSSTSYCIASTPGVVPTSVTAGQSGNIFSSTCYTDATRQKLTETRNVTYVATAGTSNALNFQVVTTTTDPNNIVLSVEGDTYAITTAGTANLIQVTVTETSNGITTKLTAQ